MPFASSPVDRLPAPLAGAVNRLLGVDRLKSLIDSARTDELFPHDLLRRLQVNVEITNSDRARIPSSGPVIAVSNHPFGILDSATLAALFLSVRSDVRILANRNLRLVEGLRNICFFIDPFDNPSNRATNAAALRQSIAHVRRGGMLVIFPAGEVSHFDLRARAIRDPQWRSTAARLVRSTKAQVLPVLVPGSNGLAFQFLGLVHPMLRTAALPSEFLNKRGASVEVRIGSPIAPDVIAGIADDAAAIGYMRLRCELLGRRGTVSSPAPRSEEAPLAEPVSGDILEGEVQSLPALCFLDRMQELEIFIAEAAMIPNVLLELGRLRETTFRLVGEGSGAERDLDPFDPSYLHLFIWNRERREIVGAYRIGDVPRLLARYGESGLYTNTLFRFRPGYLQTLGPALELGRSFIRPEYQRQFQPLLLLWKGISAYVARRPEYATLIGAVSVSSQYSLASRELIARCFAEDRANPVQPRRPLRGGCIHSWEISALRHAMRDPDDLMEPIQDLESDGKGLPVLVRQYLKLGGKLLAFSVDPGFGNTLDGFVTLNLCDVPLQRLARYMGRDQAAAFLAWHNLSRRIAA